MTIFDRKVVILSPENAVFGTETIKLNPKMIFNILIFLRKNRQLNTW